MVAKTRTQRILLSLSVAAALVLLVFVYDVSGYQAAVRFEMERVTEPEAVLGRWKDYQRWHPSRHLFLPASRGVDPAKVAHWQAMVDEVRNKLNGSPATRAAEDEAAQRERERLELETIEAARAHSAQHPLEFAGRHERYRKYLDIFPEGKHAGEASEALGSIAKDWDRHDYRSIRDHFHHHLGETWELTAKCRAYLSVHPRGQFASSATELLKWSERIVAPHDYRVILRSGEFERRFSRWLSRGPDLSIEIEVAGIIHGPSSIVANSYTPQWNYEYPRPVRWRVGDPVRIRIHDHDYWKRTLLELIPDETDKLSIRFVSDTIWFGRNRLTFDSDFTIPELPTVE